MEHVERLWACVSTAVGGCLESAGIVKLAAAATGDSKAKKQKKYGRTQAKECANCKVETLEYSQGSRDDILCRECLRKEDEARLEPITSDERRGLDLVAGILDAVPWSFWKPGEQPAALLDWLFLGDLEEAVDFELLQRKGIGAVVNLINWWELQARLPEVADIESLYSQQGVAFLESDSEDRLFFDIVGKSWPEVEAFLKKCKASGQRVLVNCKAGHNRSACVCICWLVVHEGMTLVDALEWVLLRRGTILSNHGFRLQLVRLALRLGRLGEATTAGNVSAASVGIGLASGLTLSSAAAPARDKSTRPELGSIITRKRLAAKYDMNSRDFGASSGPAKWKLPVPKGTSLIDTDVAEHLSQRSLKRELLACLYHHGENFRSRYEYTSDPPKVIGSGFSGDVVLCKNRERTAVSQNKETGVRCVKRFFTNEMTPDRLDKLKNECLIYLSLEHPHIARLFDVFEDDKEVSLVMQYCSGGTLEDALRRRGAYKIGEFRQVAVQMLLAVNYIHSMGIVHRDIKPRNWVYEADGETAKLIDFGFSTKALTVDAGLGGCMGTLGYLAPEVVRAGLSSDINYTEKCDIWSLGAVFYELVAGVPAFHREQGQCDGYTEEVVLREIEDVTEESINQLLVGVEEWPCGFLRMMLTKDPDVRPSAQEMLEDSFLMEARQALRTPTECLSVGTVLERFRAHSQASKTSRAWLLAVARSPTYLPWPDFCTLRNTFKMFDAWSMTGTITLEAFLAVVLDALCKGPSSPEDENFATSLENDVRNIWYCICGEQESLSYCEFLAMLLPPTEDVFEDVSHLPMVGEVASSGGDLASLGGTSPGSSRNSLCHAQERLTAWDASAAISCFLPLLRARRREKIPIFAETVTVRDVVQAMSIQHHRYVIVRYRDGRQSFFDYMDINHSLTELSAKGKKTPSSAMAEIVKMPVGDVANCSGHCPFVPMRLGTPIRHVLRIIATGSKHASAKKTPVSSDRDDSQCMAPRRVPILNECGEVIHVFSCIDFLDIALRFSQTKAVLKSLSARVFDRRNSILKVSVQHDAPLQEALKVMDSSRHTVCPATLKELSGVFGGLVASNVVSVADLKLVILEDRLDVLDFSVNDFITWRQGVTSNNVDYQLRQQRLLRFNVVSVDAGDSLHTLAYRLLASKLQRIFLSSDEISRIVGIVSSRDILVEVLDQLL